MAALISSPTPDSFQERVAMKSALYFSRPAAVFSRFEIFPSVFTMAMVAPLAMSQTKEDLLEALGLPLDIYNLMAVSQPVTTAHIKFSHLELATTNKIPTNLPTNPFPSRKK